MSIYYHATPKARIFNIMKNGLHASLDGYVYLCKDEQSCLMFMKMYHPEGGKFAVIPIELNDSDVKISNDHNYEVFPVDAFIYKGNIPPALIPNDLNKIHLYKIS